MIDLIQSSAILVLGLAVLMLSRTVRAMREPGNDTGCLGVSPTHTRFSVPHRPHSTPPPLKKGS